MGITIMLGMKDESRQCGWIGPPHFLQWEKTKIVCVLILKSLIVVAGRPDDQHEVFSL